MRVVILLLAILALSAFVGCQSKPMDISESGSGSEGIKVHGDWTVEVTNPDGSLATRRQFRNEFIGQHLVAFLLSYDPEEVVREVYFMITDEGASVSSHEAKCEESTTANPVYAMFSKIVLANTIHAPNDNGQMVNSIWNATCTLEITGDEPKFLKMVKTLLNSDPFIPKAQGNNTIYPTVSSKELDEPIEVWDGQGISATVILSVE